MIPLVDEAKKPKIETVYNGFHLRKLIREDTPKLKQILSNTGVFRTEEISVAMELMDIFLNNPDQRDYDIYCAAGEHEEPLGYVCFGPVAVSVGTYDLYWIAVDPNQHRRGIGRALQQYVEEIVASQGGRLVVAETSSLPKYEKTRNFYLSLGYKEVARISEYYAVGDDLVIYGKYL
jgi:ribosomal protein S18 acetylase RimI-like enzyme